MFPALNTSNANLKAISLVPISCNAATFMLVCGVTGVVIVVVDGCTVVPMPGVSVVPIPVGYGQHVVDQYVVELL